MKSPGLKNERGRKQRDQQPAGCGPFAAVSGGASRRAAPIKYSGGRRGRSAALPCAGRAGAAGRSPLAAGGGGPGGRGPSGRTAGLRRAAEFRNLPGRGGQAGTWQQSGGEGPGGAGRGGRVASISPMGLSAVGMPSREEGAAFTERLAGVSACWKGWR